MFPGVRHRSKLRSLGFSCCLQNFQHFQSARIITSKLQCHPLSVTCLRWHTSDLGLLHKHRRFHHLRTIKKPTSINGVSGRNGGYLTMERSLPLPCSSLLRVDCLPGFKRNCTWKADLCYYSLVRFSDVKTNMENFSEESIASKPASCVFFE